MIKSFIINNKKKIGLIGIVLAFIIGLILLINYFMPKTGILQSRLNRQLSADTVYVTDSNVGHYVTRYFDWGERDYWENTNLYCIQKGKDFHSGKYKVEACYYVRGLELRRLTREDNGQAKIGFVDGPYDYQYHIAVLYAMSQQTRTKKENYTHPTTPSQDAIWAICNYYSGKTESGWGYANSDAKLDKLSGESRKIAEDAITFAEYMYKRKEEYKTVSNGIENKTDTAKLTREIKTIDNTEYLISGPYKINFATVKSTYNLGGTKQSKFGSIAVYEHDGKKLNQDYDIKVCDKDGNAQTEGVKYISSHSNTFYLRIPKEKLVDSSKTFTIYYYGTKLTNDSEYYYLKTNYDGNQELIEGKGQLDSFEDTCEIKIDQIGKIEKEEVGSLEYKFDIDKKDDTFQNILKGADFEYTVHNGEVVYQNGTVRTNDEGLFEKTTITIDEKMYNLLPDSKECYITIQEKLAPDGYNKINGNIQIKLYLERASSKKDTISWQGNSQVITKHYEIKITKVEITNNTDKKIKIYDIEKDKQQLYETTSNEVKFEIPNTPIEYPSYEIDLQKYGIDSETLLKGAIFNVKIGPEDAQSDTEKDVFYITTDSDLVGDVNGDGEINQNDLDEIKKCIDNKEYNSKADIDKNGTVSIRDYSVLNKMRVLNYTGFTNNQNNLTIHTNHQDGKFTINLNDIKYQGTIKVEINETIAPGNYKKIAEKLVLSIPITSDRTIGDVTVEGNSQTDKNGYNVTIDKNQCKAIINAYDKNISVSGEDKIKLKKQDNNGNVLAGVEFTIYDKDGKKLDSIRSGSNGITDDFVIEYEYEGEYEENQTTIENKYIIKETGTVEGYKGLSDDETIELTMIGKVVTEDNQTIIKTDSYKLKNCTNDSIYYYNNQSELIRLEKNQEIQIIKNSSNDNRIVAVVQNEHIGPGQYSLKIEKNDKAFNNKLNGATFALYKTNPLVGVAEPISTSTTENDGIATLNIPLNNTGKYTYYIKEINAPDGYKSLESNEYIRVDIKVEYEGNQYKVSDIVIFNRLKDKNIKIGDTIIQSNGDAINDPSINDAQYDSKINDAINGTSINDEQNDGKIENDESIKKLSNIDNIQITIPNEPKTQEGTYSIGITKENSKNNNKLAGAEFTVKDSKGNAIASDENPLITNSDGYVRTEDIQIKETDWSMGSRTFIIKEIKAPDGFKELGEDEHIRLEIYFMEKEVNNIKTYAVKEIILTNNTSVNIGLNDVAEIEQLKLDEEGNFIKKTDENGNELKDENGEYIYETETRRYLEPGKSSVCLPQNNPTINIIVLNNPKEEETKIDLALKKFISGVKEDVNSNSFIVNTSSEREPIYDKTSLAIGTEAKYRFGNAQAEKTSLQPVEVSNGNIVQYVIRIYNEGQSDGYASKIKDYLPYGVELAENSAINEQYGWVKGDNNSIITDYLKDKKIDKYDGGVTIHSEDIKLELKVTESDMYIGTLKNVAEISEIKDQDGKTISKDIDSTPNNTTITRNGETIDDKYTPTTKDWAGKYYDDVSYGEDDVDFEYIILNNPVIAGRIWLDINEPTTKNPPENDIIDRHEILSGEETYRTLKENGGLVAKLYKNGTYWKDININDDGTYEISVPKSDDGKTYNSYEVRYTYNGMDYTNVLKNVGDDNKINSKAAEVDSERIAFNNRFGTIDGQSEVTYSSNSEKTISKYNITDNMKIDATTGTITLSKDTKADDLKYYNLGLKRRPTFDLALIKDVRSATVTVNGQSETYTYDKLASYNPSTQSFDEFIVKLRNGDFNSSLGIRDTDRDALNSVVATYSLRILNQSSTFGEATIVKDYYDNSIYDVSRVYIRDNDNTIDVNYRVENGVIIITVPGHVLGNNESYYVYVDLAVKAEKIAELKDVTKKLEPMNYAEICAYKTYTDKSKTSTPGIIDLNSAPDNYASGFNENDTGRAPIIYIGDRDTSARTLSGNVFEDIESRPNITGAKVQLVEITADGSFVVRDEVETIGGNYTFTGFLPGNYFVRFCYGNDKKTVLTTANGGMNEASYNGQDYASTDNMANHSGDYWYTDIENNQSDADDNKTRRYEVNSYSQVLTNHIAEVLNSWKDNPINEEKVQELIEKTNMFADTARMKLSVEYATEVTSNGVQQYEVSGIDFGLKKRPTNEIELTKNVSKITLKSSSGETLVEAEPTRTGSNVQWIANSFVKVEQEDVLINGANLEIEYTMTLENTGEEKTKVLAIVDYVDNNLRFDELANEGWQVVKASDLTQKDAIDELKALNIEAANDLTSTTELIDGTLVDEGIDLNKRQTIIVTKVDNTELKPGDTIEIEKLTLTKTLTTGTGVDDDLSYENKAEILSTYNANGRKTELSIPGNLDPDPDPDDDPPPEPDEDESEPVTITNPTGQTRIYYVLGLAVAVILAAGVISIKKFVLDKKA